MKKILPLITLITLISCSSDSPNPITKERLIGKTWEIVALLDENGEEKPYLTDCEGARDYVIFEFARINMYFNAACGLQPMRCNSYGLAPDDNGRVRISMCDDAITGYPSLRGQKLIIKYSEARNVPTSFPLPNDGIVTGVVLLERD